MVVSVAVWTQYANVTGTRRTPHDGIGRTYAQHRAAKKNCDMHSDLIPIIIYYWSEIQTDSMYFGLA